MSFKLKIDKSAWTKMKKDLLKTNQMELKVGYFEGSNYGPENDNLPVAQVAQWNEEGSATNPTRPFIRVGFMGPIKKGAYDSYFAESMQRIAEGKSSFKQEYTKLGPILVADLKDVIAKWDTPPNSPKTIENKGFNNPLIDSGTMYESTSFEVGKRGDD